MRTCLQDLLYAIRSLRNARGLAAVAALTLTIGIGANTAIFSIVDSILLRPLPYRDPGRLVRLYETEAAPGQYPFAGPDFIDWKAQNHTFQDMTLFDFGRDVNLSGEGRPEHVIALGTAANFFSVFGVAPLLGRTWAAGEDQPGKNHVAVLTYALWRDRFAGDPAIVGRAVSLNGEQHTIVGVMPPSFRFPARAQMWIPMDMSPKGLGERGSHWASALGHLKPGVSLSSALADLKLIAARLEKTYPNSNDKVGATAVMLHDDLVGKSRDSLLLMLSAVALVLLIACANVANLLLSRAVSRQREMAVRCALGASRFRLVRQLLTESLLLSSVGGALGLLAAWGLVAWFATAKSAALPRFTLISLNSQVLLFTFGLALATGLLFGLAPALRTSRPDLHDELKGGAGSLVSPGKRRRFTSDLLVIGEMALSLLLLVGAGLLLKDFTRLRYLDIGVRSQGVLTAAIRLGGDQYKTPAQRFQFARSLDEKLARIPGVDAASFTNRLPLEGGANYYVKLRGQTTGMTNQLVEYHTATPDYFRAMGIPLVEGRLFTPAEAAQALALEEKYTQLTESGGRFSDRERDAIVMPTVINQSMARYFWPNRSALGQMYSRGSDHGPWMQVIGVVGDVRQWGLTHKPLPESYEVFDGDTRLFLVLHTSLPPESLASPVRAALGQVDAGLPLFLLRTMDRVIAENLQGQQFLSVLVGAFAALALLLAAIGIYGVLSYAVTQRTREIGIRMSLGANRARVLRDIVLAGMRLALFGFLAGLAGALALGRVLSSLLYEVKPADPLIFLATAGLLALVALIACYLPARRAASLDPTTALRYE